VKQPDAHSHELPGDGVPPSLHHGSPQHDDPHQSELRLNWDKHVSGGARSMTAPCSSTAYGLAPCHGAYPHASPAPRLAQRQPERGIWVYGWPLAAWLSPFLCRLPGATTHGPHGLVTCWVWMDASPRQIQVKTPACSFSEDSLPLTRSNKVNLAD